MPLKKAFNDDALNTRQKRNMSIAGNAINITRRGIQGDNLVEPLPNFRRTKSETIYEGSNNTSIVLGRDRPGEAGSGYGNQTGAGTIDMVVGRVSSDIQQSIVNDQSLEVESLYVDNNLSRDASRIYISQKTDVDTNFNLPSGLVGESKAKAAIAIKSDAIRIISREGIKIISQGDKANSHGAKIRTIPAIDIIAGSSDANNEPIVKGKTLRKVLKDIMTRIDELNSTLDTFMTAQVEFNAATCAHEHPDPMLRFLGSAANGDQFSVNNGKVPFSAELLQSGIKCFANQSIAKTDGVINKLSSALTEMNISEVYGAKESSSDRVNVS